MEVSPETLQRALTTAVRHADPKLSRFDPLSRILYFDDFDDGYNGWVGLIGNYEGSLDTMLPGYAQLMQPMLSNVTHWDTGSHGAFDGTYCLKTTTRPIKGAQNVTLKRVTFEISSASSSSAISASSPKRTRCSCPSSTYARSACCSTCSTAKAA
jgi:hypothetical protein